MQIQKLTIQGFKSFKNKTEISLKPGINAFVGPNSSGKTNLAKAIVSGLDGKLKESIIIKLDKGKIAELSQKTGIILQGDIKNITRNLYKDYQLEEVKKMFIKNASNLGLENINLDALSSLSESEQALTALSLFFAVQEYKNCQLYILDEIDCNLDKYNSEKLSLFLEKLMKEKQAIIITHNDALIKKSTSLYGVSKEEGISKVIGLGVK